MDLNQETRSSHLLHGPKWDDEENQRDARRRESENHKSLTSKQLYVDEKGIDERERTD